MSGSLTWRQLYDLDELPTHLVVVGSGVTGAEFVHAYTELGVKVTLVSNRDRVLPGEDEDAALVLEDALAERGVTLVKNARADKVTRDGDEVTVFLADGQTVTGSRADDGRLDSQHEQMWARSRGCRDGQGGYITVDRVSRTSVPASMPPVTAPGCSRWPRSPRCRDASRCTTRWAGSPADSAEDGRVGDLHPPEIATVGVSQNAIDSGEYPARTVMLPLATNARAKMSGLRRGL